MRYRNKCLPPLEDGYKVNVDVAVDINLNRGAIAVIIRDKQGELKVGTSKRIICNPVCQDEAMVVKEAMLFNHNPGIN